MNRRLRLMLKPLLFLAILAGIAVGDPAARANESDLDFHRPDHRLHAGVGFVATVLAHEAVKAAGVSKKLSPAVAVALVMGAAYIKEKTDRQFSLGDIKATGVGAGAACLLVYTFRF